MLKTYPPLFLLILTLFFCKPDQVMGQAGTIHIAKTFFDDEDGIRFVTADSTSAVSLRFRMQNRAVFESKSGSNLEIDEAEAFIRRFRLRSKGFLVSKRLTYAFQLGFTPGDMDAEDSPYLQIIRDAMVYYDLTSKLRLGFGQTKLPGNRQRVVSSGELQFVDRSIVNATFNIDRDFGFQAIYQDKISNLRYNLHGALSTGDGRNINAIAGSGAAYTARAELLPFGDFNMDGDYFEGDWYREPTPKLSVGATYSANDKAARTAGQRGKFLYQKSDITSYMADALLKYQGIAWYTEYIRRTAGNPVTTEPVSSDTRFIFTGTGFNTQLSYQFPSHFEIAGRYSVITPKSDVEALTDKVNQYTLGSTYYIRWHRIKLQTDLTYQTRERLPVADSDRNNWILRMQVELGI